MRTFDKGTITELEVQLLLVKKGFQVFTPVNEGCRVDLICVDQQNITSRVQVKTCYETASGFGLDLAFSINSKRTEKGFYTEKEIDYFATARQGELYLIPIRSVLNRRRVVFRIAEKTFRTESLLAASDFRV